MDIFIAKNGQQIGPFSEEQLKSMIQSGMAGLSDQAWHQGLEEWSPLHRVLNLPPPIPHATQSPKVSYQTASTEQAIVHTGNLAGFGRRLGASLIDIILVLLFCAAIEAVFSPLNGKKDYEFDWFVIRIQVPLIGLYCALMECSKMQATIGKLACGLVVTDLSGRRISYKKAFLRYLARYISAVFILVGYSISQGTQSVTERLDTMSSSLILSAISYVASYLMCLWTSRKQCLHDMLTGCVVVNKAATPPR